MKKILLLFFSFALCFTSSSMTSDNKYVIAIRESLKSTEWMDVVEVLQQSHESSTLLFYQNSLHDIFDSLKEIQPRYLCVIDIPENLNRGFVVEGNRMSRMMSDGIYDDYIWGIITGYSVEDALRIARQSNDPFVLNTALSSTSEVSNGRWFADFAWLDDGTKGQWGEKKSMTAPSIVHKNEPFYNLLPIFKKKWEEIDPDFIITSSHATQYNLEMPFSTGNIKSKDGQLYANFNTPQNMPSTSKPRVYFPVGNCLIGDIDNSPQSMAVAWLSSGGATAMLGYVIETWYGRNGWGALKFFLSNPGKFTLAEAAFLNRQDMLTNELRKNPKFLDINPDVATFGHGVRDIIDFELGELGVEFTKDDLGYIYDRDVVVYYGDPAWDVRVQNPSKTDDYEFNLEEKDGKYIITLSTYNDFSIDKFAGKGFKEEHVKDIPLAFFFPYAVEDAVVIENKADLDIAYGKNFLLIYNQNIKANAVYKVVLK